MDNNNNILRVNPASSTIIDPNDEALLDYFMH